MELIIAIGDRVYFFEKGDSYYFGGGEFSLGGPDDPWFEESEYKVIFCAIA